MCGRFYIDPSDMSDAELIALLDREKSQTEDRRDDLLTLGEIQPGQNAAVIALNKRLDRRAFKMKWGYHLQNRLVFNARSETAAEKPLFSGSTANRRCLIPASAYFEWDHRQKPYTKYRFHVTGQHMIYLAGLYRFEPDFQQAVFTILTREAAPDIACFHDRMPVIIPPALTEAWLDQSQDFRALLSHAHTQVGWQAAATS